MVEYIDEDASFSLQANILSAGYQTVIPQGYLVSRRNDGVYVARLIPDLFYGVSGQPLSGSWRQNYTSTGAQTILSRSGGQPHVPRDQLWWTKISDDVQHEQVQQQQEVKSSVINVAFPDWLPYAIVALIAGGLLVWSLKK